uniref:60S ribosomal protein L31 n=1 Tax=Brassica campestris TaxID=3711 RepID=M4FD46_BRACM
MAKESSGGGGGEAEQEEEERWRKRDDKDTKGRTGCGAGWEKTTHAAEKIRFRVDVKLNKQIWSRGIRGPPRRVRVYVARKRNDDEDDKEEFYSLVTVAEIPAEGLSSLGTKVIDEDE